MNMFLLDEALDQCAADHSDQHIVKMVLESAQICSSGAYLQNVIFDGQYRPGHIHHPCCVWAGESPENLMFVCRLGISIGMEYRWRFDRHHQSMRVLCLCASRLPRSLPSPELYPVCIPLEHRRESYASRLPLGRAVKEYRAYYRSAKERFVTWKYSPIPSWWA
jgi:hypothetical protein